MQKPKSNFAGLWNMCFGFFGIQIGFGLQNANTSRIFETLGAKVDNLPILWIAAPLTGLLVQPIIGHLSDRTWGGLGRRRPYFLVGAVLTTGAMLLMPNAPVLWMAAGCLWLMDASINVTMEPFRAFVGDLLPDEQRTAGFAMQSFFIGVGAVFASVLPWVLTNWLGISNTAPAGQTPPSVRMAYYVGAVALLTAVLWTICTTREYPPEDLARMQADADEAAAPPRRRSVSANLMGGGACLVAGLAVFALVFRLQLEKELYVLGGMIGGFGLAQLAAGLLRARGLGDNGLTEVVDDLFAMPRVMRSLAVVQFFSWFGLFAMWIYTTSAVTSFHYGVTDPASRAYNQGADWVGVLFGVYNGVAALASFALPRLAAVTSRKVAHAVSLALGGAGLVSFLVIRDPGLLWISMIGVGVAWASILSAPYAILSSAVPPAKMGVYMGIFNIFIVVPQLLAATLLGLVLRTLFGGQPIWALAVGGASLLLAALSVLLVTDAQDPATRARRARADRPPSGATSPRSGALRSPVARLRVWVLGLVAALMAAPSAGAAVAPGRLVALGQVPSAYVAARNVTVWLPDGYDDHVSERYAVVYMHDGNNLFDGSTAFGGEAWRPDLSVTRLAAADVAGPAIIVGVDNTALRAREYMPRKVYDALPAADRAVMDHDLGGPPVSDAYLAFLVKELKPLIDHRFRTRPDRAHTAVMGSSMGGLISLYAVTEYPDVFGAAGCLSTHWPLPARPVDPPKLDRAEVLAAFDAYLSARLPRPGGNRIWFDHGDQTLDRHYAPYQEHVDATLTRLGWRRGLDFESRVYPGAAHNEASWRQRLDDPMRFLLAPAPPGVGG